MKSFLGFKPLISEKEIQVAVKKLADDISKDYKGKDLIAIGILNGAYIFFADLMRQIEMPANIGFIRATSYSGRETTGTVQTQSCLSETMEGKDVLLVDDIVDSGFTIQFLLKEASKQKPRSLKVCTLLEKKGRRKVKVPLDYVGFEIPDKFVVGYGMDFNNQFRNLPFISIYDNTFESSSG
jgi:hypoxanthine phosphoribosyltransferase